MPHPKPGMQNYWKMEIVEKPPDTFDLTKKIPGFFLIYNTQNSLFVFHNKNLNNFFLNNEFKQGKMNYMSLEVSKHPKQIFSSYSYSILQHILPIYKIYNFRLKYIVSV